MDNYDGVIGIVFRRTNPLRFLLIKNKKSGNLTFPAGGREKEEKDSKQTLIREIKEETGLVLSEYNIIKTPFVNEFIYNCKKGERAGLKVKQIVYLVETTKENLNSEDPFVTIGGWYSIEEMMEKLTFPDAKNLLQEIIKFI